MEPNIEEALKAKEIAEKRFCERDFAGAKSYALKVKSLCPGLEGISQMVSTFGVYVASKAKCNGEIDYCSILGLKPSANKEAVKKQYKKLAVLLHPDKNKCVGADGAFKLVYEAWTLLSDRIKRNKQMSSGVVQTSTRATGLHVLVMQPHKLDLTLFGLYAHLVKLSTNIFGNMSIRNFHARTTVVRSLLLKLDQHLRTVLSPILPGHMCQVMDTEVMEMGSHMSQQMLLFSLEMGSQDIILGTGMSMFLTCPFSGARTLERLLGL